MNQLILHPRDIHASPAPGVLLDALAEIAFIGTPFDYQGHTHYRPGEDFLELITFLGCSPVVSLGEPGLTGDDFCHISVLPELREATLLHGSNVKPPRCPHCRHPHADWREMLAAWQQQLTDYLHECPNCAQQTPPHRLKWRQSAGMLRSGIAVWGIYEGEAVPSERLLDTLKDCGDGPWGYFYRSE